MSKDEPGEDGGRRDMDANPELGRKVARTICGIMMFEGDEALKKISVLSGGERAGRCSASSS
jgi:ATPase subunit of ABC transporter with duplicated ATPase domains